MNDGALINATLQSSKNEQTQYMIHVPESHKCNEWESQTEQCIMYNSICIKYKNKQHRRAVSQGEEGECQEGAQGELLVTLWLLVWALAHRVLFVAVHLVQLGSMSFLRLLRINKKFKKKNKFNRAVSVYSM